MDSEPLQIVVVDPRKSVARALTRSLTQLGYAVSSAHDEPRALELSHTAQVAIVTLMLSAKLDPITVGRRLLEKAAFALIYIVETTDAALLLEARRTVPSGYLFRPFTAEALRGSIELVRPMPLLREGGLRGDVRESYTRELRRHTPFRVLSPREIEIYQSLVRGERPPTIGRRFFISIHTVRRHVQAIFRKLNVHSQIELIHDYGEPDRRTKRDAG